MTSRISPDSARVFRSLGYTVDGGFRRVDKTIEFGLTIRVQADGAWRVTRGKVTVGEGKESHPCLAACDANECAWKERDRLRTVEMQPA